MKIKFTPRAYLRLDEVADYIYKQTLSKQITANYVRKLRTFIRETLIHFPLSGRPCEEYASGARKLVYQGFSVIYRISEKYIEILTIYRENLP